MQEEYKNIAAYEGREIAEAMNRLLQSKDFLNWFQQTTGRAFSPMLRLLLVSLLRLSRHPLRLLDRLAIFPFLDRIRDHSTTALTITGLQNLPSQGGAFFITNHRDIILDAAFLSILLVRHNGPRPRLGVGSNLFGHPWIEDVMRMCGCFTVIRNCGPREVVRNAELLSSYIADLQSRGQSVWMAQREGRAKDGDDRTQPAVLKMLTLAEKGSLLERIAAMHITPVSISYEYDPCDWLKAREMQLKRDNPDYRKTPQEDILNMQTGLRGQKGEVHFVVTPCINPELVHIDTTLSRNEQLSAVAALIDRHIHRGYHLAWTNIAARDILAGESNPRFEDYIQSRIALIDIPNRDDSFLRQCLLTMYANPAINQLTVNKLIVDS